MIDEDRALAPLTAASAAIDRLDTYRNPQELAESLQAIGQAVERALRQLLRADTTAPDELRLAALSPTDLPLDRLIPALRKHDLISIPLAGMLHDLMQAQTRAASNDVRAADADNARNAVRRLKEDIHARAQNTTAVAGDVMNESRASASTRVNAANAKTDATVRQAAHNAVQRGDVAEDPRAIATSGRSLRGRALLPIILLAMLVLVIWGVMHFAMGSATDMSTGVTAFEQQRWGVAEQSFRAQIDKHPKDVTARLYLGRVLRAQGRSKEAGQVLNDARKLDGKDADVLRELGGVFMDLKQPATAVTACREAQELEPKDAANWVCLVSALRAAGDPSAEDVLSRAPADAQAKLRQ